MGEGPRHGGRETTVWAVKVASAAASRGREGDEEGLVAGACFDAEAVPSGGGRRVLARARQRTHGQPAFRFDIEAMVLN